MTLIHFPCTLSRSPWLFPIPLYSVPAWCPTLNSQPHELLGEWVIDKCVISRDLKRVCLPGHLTTQGHAWTRLLNNRICEADSGLFYHPSKVIYHQQGHNWPAAKARLHVLLTTVLVIRANDVGKVCCQGLRCNRLKTQQRNVHLLHKAGLSGDRKIGISRKRQLKEATAWNSLALS